MYEKLILGKINIKRARDKKYYKIKKIKNAV
jgi:hypothetical protein